MRSRAFVALLVACAATPAGAADLWLVAEGVNGMTVSSDAATLACDHLQCSIWEETRYAAARPDGVLTLRDLAVYDCAGDRTRTQAEVKLGADGRVLKTVKATGEYWLPVQPDSVGATTRAFACNFQTASAAGVRSGEFDAEGRRFVRVSPDRTTMAAPPVRAHAVGIAVQIAATQSDSNAQRAISEFKRRRAQDLLPDLEIVIEPVTVGGAPVFRVLIRGFTTQPNAQRFCARLKARGDDCIVRPITGWDAAAR